MLQQHLQDFQRLFLKFDLDSALAEFACAEVPSNTPNRTVARTESAMNARQNLPAEFTTPH
jgi:hypothetical protein